MNIDNYGCIPSEKHGTFPLILPLTAEELLLNIYNHHTDVVLTMRPIEGMWGDMGNINGDSSVPSKRCQSLDPLVDGHGWSMVSEP